MVPLMVPSAKTSIFEPGLRGVEPSAPITTQSTAAFPLLIASDISLKKFIVCNFSM
jgi:hypothetical protein